MSKFTAAAYDGVAFLNIMSYNVLGGLRHFYGTIKFGDYSDRKVIDVTYAMSQAQAARLTRQEHGDYRYREGDQTSRFEEEADCIAAARKQWRKAFPDATLLLLGDSVYAEPMPAIDGPPDLVRHINDVYAAFDANGHWDGDRKSAQQYSEQFFDLLAITRILEPVT